jgi:hypothetical protein
MVKMAITDGLNQNEKEIFTAIRREKGGSPSGQNLLALIITLILAVIVTVVLFLPRFVKSFRDGWNSQMGGKKK